VSDVLDDYAYWILRLSERDRQYVRDQQAEVVRTLAIEPDRPIWLELYFRWTVVAMDSPDPAAALRRAVEFEVGDPAEVCRALAAIDRTSREWAEWWPAHHPSPN
jgi:hypothetical protein